MSGDLVVSAPCPASMLTSDCLQVLNQPAA